MNLKKIMTAVTAGVILMAAAASAITLVGCQSVPRVSVSQESDISIDEIPESSMLSEVITTEPAQSYPDYPVSYPKIEKQFTGQTYEAEECDLGEGLTAATERTNYSGEGYVTGFSGGKTGHLDFDVDMPSNQHYDISFCIASDSVSNCVISLNDSEIRRFDTTSDGKFTVITLYGVFIVKGKSVIGISTKGDIDVDYLKVTSNTSLGKIEYDTAGWMSNENAGEPARQLMGFLAENYGKYIISGQYVSGVENKELDSVYSITGKYPVIRFSALENPEDSFDENYKEIDAAADWYKNGGIIGFMWHWEAPGENSSVLSSETDFRLGNAVTQEDIALLSEEEIRGLYGEGKISEECYGIILDIDNMAGQLMTLKDRGIPVLWRPLHEGSGDWFWWGADGVENYKWLWKLMYRRMTEYFDLDNLIWIWNGQSESTIVDRDTFDIASLDIYLSEGEDFGSRYDKFAKLQQLIGSDKLIALSECSSVPNADESFRDNAVWSFFGLWYGDYLLDEEGGFSEKYSTKDEFIHSYNSSGVMTLDEYREIRRQEATYENTAGAGETAGQESGPADG